MFPGETLIVHLGNDLHGLTVRDYFSPHYMAKGQTVPIYPEQLTSSPLNLHVHGVHVSPKGNADNVLVHIPAGMSNTYTYNIPTNMPHGRILVSQPSARTDRSAGLYGSRRPAGDRTHATATCRSSTEKHIPIRNMLLQYNFVFDRDGGQAQLNNPNWPQYVSTITPPKGDELGQRNVSSIAGAGELQSVEEGRTVFYGVVCWAACRSATTAASSSSSPATCSASPAHDGQSEKDVPENPQLPDYQRDVQFTVNGQFQPVINSKAGQTEIWVLANVSDIAYMNVQLTETATGRHPKIAIVGQDGNPYSAVQHSRHRRRHAARSSHRRAALRLR